MSRHTHLTHLRTYIHAVTCTYIPVAIVVRFTALLGLLLNLVMHHIACKFISA